MPAAPGFDFAMYRRRAGDPQSNQGRRPDSTGGTTRTLYFRLYALKNEDHVPGIGR